MVVAGAIALACAVVDQIIKALVVRNMPLFDQIDLLPFFALYHTRNTGIAFSFLSGMSDTIMVAFTGAVMIFIGWLALRTERHQWIAHIGFAFILGGALGNIIDRAVLGYVVDYFLFHTPSWSFAVFNMADVFISIGAGLVILQEFLDWRRGAHAVDAADDKE